LERHPVADVPAIFAGSSGRRRSRLQLQITDLAQGELRCEESGAVVIRIAGKDYAVNGAASSRYPPVQQIWNSATYPNVDIARLTVKGLTLCDWSAPPPKHHTLLKR
jgi:hypothetical protein